MKAIEYRPHIDGLRAVAIVPVLLFHLGVDWLPGGYLGVDVFFVISGFLITSILLREMVEGRFSFKRFWLRRIRRIVPNLVVVTAATLVATWSLVFPPDRPAIGRQAVATLLSFANFYFWRHANNYWGPQAEDSPFLHAWSLAVEEQFYIFFPLALYLIDRWRPRRIALGLSMILAASFCLFLYGVTASPAATFYLLPTRAWELATGALLAAVLHGGNAAKIPRWVSMALAYGGLGCTVASYFCFPGLSGWTVVPVLGTALVICFGNYGWVRTLLSQWAMVYVGKISYSLYLWHWPVIVLSRHLSYDVSPSVLVLLIASLSIASHYLIEEPFRRAANVLPQIAVAFFFVLLGGTFMATVTPQKLDGSKFNLHSYSQYYNIHPHYEKPGDTAEVLKKLDIPESLVSPSVYLDEGIVVGPSDGPPRVVVLGDSHGCVWAHAIRTACADAGLKVALYCMAGVRPFFTVPPMRDQRAHRLNAEEKYEYDLARIRHISIWKPEFVFVCCRWSIAKPGDSDGLLAFLQDHAKCVVLVEQPPELACVGKSNMAEVAAFRGFHPQLNARQYWPQGNAKRFQDGCGLIQSLAAKFPNCEVMPTADLFIEDSRVFFLDGASLLYQDDNHLTTAGTAIAAPRIRAILAR